MKMTEPFVIIVIRTDKYFSGIKTMQEDNVKI